MNFLAVQWGLTNRNVLSLKGKVVEKIRTLYQSMNHAEKRYFKQYVLAFHGKGKSPNKMVSFIRLLEEQPEITQERMARQLYTQAGDKAFLMLKKRMLECMLETLSLSFNFQNNPLFKEDPPAFRSLMLKKELGYAILLKRRGLTSLAEDLLQKCVNQAEKWDLPEVKLEALIQLRNLSRCPEMIKKTFSAEIRQTLASYETAIMGAGFFDEMRATLPGEMLPQQVSYLSEKASFLEKRLQRAYSARAHYYQLCMQLLLEEANGKNLEKAREWLNSLINLLNEHRGLQSKNRLGVPFKQLAEIELKSRRFPQALDAAKKALDILPETKTNYVYTAIYYIYACIYLGKLPQATVMLDKLGWFYQNTADELIPGWLQYLRACILYLSGETTLAYTQLQQNDILMGYKQDWNPAIRVLEILMLLDQGHEDIATSKVESLRKHLSRHLISPRYDYIYRYLRLSEKNGFRISPRFTEGKLLIDQIRNRDAWDPLSQEVIRFEWWVKSKEQGRPLLEVLVEEATASFPSVQAQDEPLS